jgi:Flp pilus assembly pilin Flp
MSHWLRQLVTRKKQQRRGMLTLEWVLIITVVVIGIIGGLGAVRNATVGELSDLAEAIESLNVKTAAECEAEGAAPCTAAEATAEGS